MCVGSARDCLVFCTGMGPGEGHLHPSVAEFIVFSDKNKNAMLLMVALYMSRRNIRKVFIIIDCEDFIEA